MNEYQYHEHLGLSKMGYYPTIPHLWSLNIAGKWHDDDDDDDDNDHY